MENDRRDRAAATEEEEDHKWLAEGVAEAIKEGYTRQAIRLAALPGLSSTTKPRRPALRSTHSLVQMFSEMLGAFRPALHHQVTRCSSAASAAQIWWARLASRKRKWPARCTNPSENCYRSCHTTAARSGRMSIHMSTHVSILMPIRMQVWPGHGAGSPCGKSLGTGVCRHVCRQLCRRVCGKCGRVMCLQTCENTMYARLTACIVYTYGPCSYGYWVGQQKSAASNLFSIECSIQHSIQCATRRDNNDVS